MTFVLLRFMLTHRAHTPSHPHLHTHHHPIPNSYEGFISNLGQVEKMGCFVFEDGDRQGSGRGRGGEGASQLLNLCMRTLPLLSPPC